MKKFNLPLILISLIIASCNSNSDDNGQTNTTAESYLELNGTQYELKNGYFVNDNPNEFIIQLTDGTINNGVLDLENFSNDTTNGFSAYLTGSELNGDFTLTDIESTTLSASAECVKISSSEFDCSKTFELSNNSNDSGMISVIRNSNIYEINFEFTNSNGDNIKGKFTGILSELTIN